MAEYVEQFFFRDGLYDEANVLLTKETQAVEDGKNFIMQSNNVRTVDTYSRDSGSTNEFGYGSPTLKSYYGDETNPEPGSYASGVSAALPILRIRKNTGNGSILRDIKIPIMAGASAASLGMYCYLLDDNLSTLASTSLMALSASTEMNVSLSFPGDYGVFKNFYLAFGITGASIAEYWGADGVRIYSRHSSYAPPIRDMYEKGVMVASLSATVETGSIGAIHLDHITGNYRDLKSVTADYFFDNVWFIVQYDNLTACPMVSALPYNIMQESWFVKKLPAEPPYTIENVIMNDRDELLIAGPSLHPHLISGASNSWNASPAIFAFQNSVIGDYTGASVYPSFMMEFKNRLHLFNVNVGQSLAAGVTIQEYPRSILPSGGFTPYLFDWNDEILIDTRHELIAGVEYKGYQFVFTEEEIFYFTYDSNGNATPVERIKGTKGIHNKEACVSTGEHVYYANSDGAFRLEGNISKKISSAINDKWFLGNRNISVIFNTVKKKILFSDRSTIEFNRDSEGCFFFDIETGAWGFQEIPIVSYKSPADRSYFDIFSYYLSLYGGIFNDFNTREAYGLALDYAPELNDIYNVTGDVEIKKKCVLSPRYDKKADPVYIHVQTKTTPYTGQGYRITTFWDGDPSLNFQQTNQSLTNNTNYLYNTDSHKFTVDGQGNILNVILERLPGTHGSKPIEFQNLQVEYDLVDAEV
jgi:hypothetical protein